MIDRERVRHAAENSPFTSIQRASDVLSMLRMLELKDYNGIYSKIVRRYAVSNQVIPDVIRDIASLKDEKEKELNIIHFITFCTEIKNKEDK